MVVRESIIVDVDVRAAKAVTGLLNTRENLTKLGRAGINTSNAIKDIDKKLGKFNVNTKRATAVMGQFKFEMLGVLFFGMAISRFFKSLLRPAFDVAETFTILNDILALLFLDTALLVNDALFNMLEILDKLPDKVTNFAGAFALIGIGVGSVISDFGIFILGITSLNSAFPSLNKRMGTFAKRWGPIAIGISLASISLSDWTNKSGEAKIKTATLTTALGALLFIFGPGKLKLIGRIIAATGVLEALLVVIEKVEAKFSVLARLESFRLGLRQTLGFDEPPAPVTVDPRGPGVASAVGGGIIFQNDLSVTVNSSEGVDGLSLGEIIANKFNELFGEATSNQLGSLSRR